MIWDALRGSVSSRVRKMALTLDNDTPFSQYWGQLGVRNRFRVIDFALNCLLFTPLVVLFQVSASGIQDVLFLNYVPGPVGTLMLLIQGIGIEFACSLWQQQLSGFLGDTPADDKKYVAITRLYHYAMAYANVCHYRGLSDMYYWLLGYGVQGAMQAVTTTIILLCGVKCARNVVGPPLGVGIDATSGDYFETTTYYRTKNDRSLQHMLDHAATVVGVTSVCNLHWIAVWAFFDCVLFPQNLSLSVVASWVIGYAIVSAAMILESHGKHFSREFEKRNANLKIMLEDAILIGANIGVILVWRGHWIFFESLGYYYPIHQKGFDMTHFYANFSAFGMLCLCYASGTAVGKGCDFDGSYSDGEGISFCVDYFADLLSEQIEEEERREKGSDEKLEEKKPANNNLNAQKENKNERYIVGQTPVRKTDAKTKKTN